MKILVTGGAGYIGSHLAHEACARGFDVTVIDDLSAGIKAMVPSKARFIEGNIGNEALLKEVFQDGIEAVFHFAAHTSVPESVENPQKYYENNTKNSSKLINMSLLNKVKYFIFSSTAAVYGNSREAVVSESSPTEPISPYGKSKLMTEQILKDVTDSKMKYAVLRYFNVAGASLKYPIGQSTKEATHLIKVAAQACTGKRKSFEIFGTDYNTADGTGIRDYIHVDDLVEAHILALQYLQSGGSSDIFNCGYQRGYSVREVVESMKRVSGKNFEVIERPRRAGDVEQIIANNEKIRTVLKFQPKHNSLDVICKSAYEWELRLS